MKKIIIILMMVTLFSSFCLARTSSSSINWASKKYLDNNFCMQNGDCTLLNLNVTGNATFKNLTVIDFNVTGDIDNRPYNLYTNQITSEGNIIIDNNDPLIKFEDGGFDEWHVQCNNNCQSLNFRNGLSGGSDFVSFTPVTGLTMGSNTNGILLPTEQTRLRFGSGSGNELIEYIDHNNGDLTDDELSIEADIVTLEATDYVNTPSHFEFSNTVNVTNDEEISFIVKDTSNTEYLKVNTQDGDVFLPHLENAYLKVDASGLIQIADYPVLNNSDASLDYLEVVSDDDGSFIVKDTSDNLLIYVDSGERQVGIGQDPSFVNYMLTVDNNNRPALQLSGTFRAKGTGGSISEPSASSRMFNGNGGISWNATGDSTIGGASFNYQQFRGSLDPSIGDYGNTVNIVGGQFQARSVNFNVPGNPVVYTSGLVHSHVGGSFGSQYYCYNFGGGPCINFSIDRLGGYFRNVPSWGLGGTYTEEQFGIYTEHSNIMPKDTYWFFDGSWADVGGGESGNTSIGFNSSSDRFQITVGGELAGYFRRTTPGDNVSLWVNGSISTRGITVRTQINNDSEALEKIKTGNELIGKDGKINHTAYGECAEIRKVPDESKPEYYEKIQIAYSYELTEPFDFSNMNITHRERNAVYFEGGLMILNQTPILYGELTPKEIIETKVRYPHLKEVVETDLECMNARQEQALALVNKEIDILEDKVKFENVQITGTIEGGSPLKLASPLKLDWTLLHDYPCNAENEGIWAYGGWDEQEAEFYGCRDKSSREGKEFEWKKLS